MDIRGILLWNKSPNIIIPGTFAAEQNSRTYSIVSSGRFPSMQTYDACFKSSSKFRTYDNYDVITYDVIAGVSETNPVHGDLSSDVHVPNAKLEFPSRVQHHTVSG